MSSFIIIWMGPTVLVRPAKISDAAQLADIGFRSWESAIHFWESNVASMRERAFQAYRDFTRESWAAIMVAELDGVPVGWGAREHSDHLISDLWIDPGYQRIGAGNALMEALEAEIAAAGQSVAMLETHARNHAAIAFYRKRGYEIRWLSTKYSPPLDRDIEKVGMEKRLDEAMEPAGFAS